MSANVFPIFLLAVLALGAGPVRAGADADAGRRKAEVCAACHGPDGNSSIAQFPILAGQTARYIYIQLRDFKQGRRKDPMMSPLVASLSKEDMLDVAEYFATQRVKPLAFTADPERAKKGKAKAAEVLCTMCHLGGFRGQNEIPRVAGQHPEYIKKQLMDFKARARTNDAGSMTSVSRTINEEDIENLAHYIAGLD